MKVLITGSNGFLGSHLVEQALTDGCEVFAGVRRNANLGFIHNQSVRIIELDYGDLNHLTNQLKNLRSSSGAFDLIIHNAGLTKSNSLKENLKVNKGVTEKLIQAIKKSEILSKSGKLCYVSSMAALGPFQSNGPVSSYGTSKLEAEKSIESSGFPYLIFRPTAIYGPRDTAFLSLFKIAKWGLYPNISSPDQKITMIYVKDVARLIIHYSKLETNTIIHLDDGLIYTHVDLKNALQKTLSKKISIFNLPKPMVISMVYFIEKAAKLLGQSPVLTLEKYGEISKDWNHDFSNERKQLDRLSLMSLEDGFNKSYEYYIKQKLL